MREMLTLLRLSADVAHDAAIATSVAAEGVQPNLAWLVYDAKEAMNASRRIQDEDAKP